MVRAGRGAAKAMDVPVPDGFFRKTVSLQQVHMPEFVTWNGRSRGGHDRGNARIADGTRGRQRCGRAAPHRRCHPPTHRHPPFPISDRRRLVQPPAGKTTRTGPKWLCPRPPGCCNAPRVMRRPSGSEGAPLPPTGQKDRCRPRSHVRSRHRRDGKRPINLPDARPGEGCLAAYPGEMRDQKASVATSGQPVVPAGGVATGCCTGPDWIRVCELEGTCSCTIPVGLVQPCVKPA